MPGAIRFLAIDDVLRLHQIAIIDQGGDPSIRDRSLLESAIAMPQQQFAGEYLHHDIPAMAAAYAFHICKNHPFVDGNKRAATAAMIAFLSDNGWRFEAPVDEAEAGILALAAGELDKPAFTGWARKHMREKPQLELRDFFAQCKLRDTHLMAESAVASGRAAEVERTLKEARTAIPMIEEFEQLSDYWRERGDAEAAGKCAFAATLLSTLYRIAEDMGYEW